jgi:hypothetical protein
MRNNKSYKGRKKSSVNIESLDSMDFEDEGFIEGDVNIGSPITAFSFGDEISTEIKEESVLDDGIVKEPITNNSPISQRIKSSPRGITPPVEGEEFTLKRCYQYRPSTVRKLNELKAQHPDVNVYLNTIIDEAIVFYYNHIFDDEKFNSDN